MTATLAELILTDADMRNRIGHPAVRDLLAWHALEESEHKAVAFDVYRSVGGSERVRVLTMRVLRFEMLLGLGLGTTVSVLFDRATYRPGVLRRSIRAFRSWNLISRQTWARLKDFERPGFHPDDRDTSTMLATWRAELFGDDGTLKDRLDTPSQRRNP